MLIIPVAGLAKAAIVVTISLHPAAAHQANGQYRPSSPARTRFASSRAGR
jgi:hypothetical protein